MSQQKYRVNQEIKTPQIRLIDADGTQLGVVTVREALMKAEERKLDLVEIAPQAVPPVCKIIDFGKFTYELQKKEKILKKKQHVTVLKEIRLHPNTDTHDFDFKTRHALNFLEDGDKVKVSVIFKGRELAYTQHGEKLLRAFIEVVKDDAKVEQDVKFEGKIMHIILSPQKSKKKK
ncbi:MAG: translation initiation factor IF-3 [bacterium]